VGKREASAEPSAVDVRAFSFKEELTLPHP